MTGQLQSKLFIPIVLFFTVTLDQALINMSKLEQSTRLFNNIYQQLEQDGWVNVIPRSQQFVHHTSFTYKFLIPNKSFLHNIATFRKQNPESHHNSFQLLIIFNEYANGSPFFLQGGVTYVFVNFLRFRGLSCVQSLSSDIDLILSILLSLLVRFLLFLLLMLSFLLFELDKLISKPPPPHH